MVQLGQALVDLAALAYVVDDVLVEDVHLAHLLVDLREVLNVLGSVLDHCGREWSLLPKLRIYLH